MALTFNDVLARQVELSYTPPQNFFMVIEKLPEVVFTAQQIQIPAISGGMSELANRFNSGKAFVPGNSLEYGQLDVTFLLDKQFKGYRTILKWLKGINAPETQEQFEVFTTEENSGSRVGFATTMSDITVFATDAANRPICHWNFKNCFPTDLDGVAFDATGSDITYLTANVSFKFTYFTHQTYTESGILNEDTL